MLDFLVLGQIPGTNIQINFSWYLFMALLALSLILHKIKKPTVTAIVKSKKHRNFKNI